MRVRTGKEKSARDRGKQRAEKKENQERVASVWPTAQNAARGKASVCSTGQAGRASAGALLGEERGQRCWEKDREVTGDEARTAGERVH